MVRAHAASLSCRARARGGGGEARLIERQVGRRGAAYLPASAPTGTPSAAHTAAISRSTSPRARQRRAEPEPVLAQGIQAFGQGHLAQQHGEAAKRGADVAAAARQHLGLRLAQQIGGAARVEHLEMGHHARLERKALEQRLTKPWMVMIGRPAGRSRTSASRMRARPAPHPSPAAEQIRESACSCSSGAVASRPSSCWTRATISAAAALVKVRHSSWPGAVPASSRRSTRSASTRVLPVPAEAVTQVEQVGRRRAAGRRWAAAGGQRRAGSQGPFAAPRQMVVVAPPCHVRPGRAR